MPAVDWQGLIHAAGNTDLGRGLVGAGHNLQRGLVNNINHAGEAVYDAGQAVSHAVEPALIRLGLREDPNADYWAQRGFPAYMTNANHNNGLLDDARAFLGGYDPKTLPKQMSPVNAYRADPTGRYGGKDGLETLPTQFKTTSNTNIDGGGSPVQLYAYARALAHAQRYGVPQLSSQQLAAIALKEGRPDYGYLSIDSNDKKGLDLMEHLMNENISSGPAQFAVTVGEKMAQAKAHGVSFEEAWNGLGRSRITGKTGADYAKDYKYFLEAAKHTKNKPLVDFIQSALDAEKPKKVQP